MRSVHAHAASSSAATPGAPTGPASAGSKLAASAMARPDLLQIDVAVSAGTFSSSDRLAPVRAGVRSHRPIVGLVHSERQRRRCCGAAHSIARRHRLRQSQTLAEDSRARPNSIAGFGRIIGAAGAVRVPHSLIIRCEHTLRGPNAPRVFPDRPHMLTRTCSAHIEHRFFTPRHLPPTTPNLRFPSTLRSFSTRQLGRP